MTIWHLMAVFGVPLFLMVVAYVLGHDDDYRHARRDIRTRRRLGPN